ncbi:MAG: PadR family transcriptional regulator [Firmicutes bacterium]|nr:PadR family transcriptional regulator [Bacillota bacterium]
MRINKELVKGSTGFLILTLLERQPAYGYQIIKVIERDSDGVFTFKEGTLYPILHALEADGMVESYWAEGEGARRRKYYRLTDAGRLHLREKQAEWRVFRSAVDQVIGEAIVWS